MAEEGTHTTPDNRLGSAVSMLAKRLQEMGVNRDAALLAAQDQRTNIYVSKDPKAPVLIRRVGGGFAELYEPNFTDPIGALAYDVFKAIPDEEKLVATQRREQELQALQAEKAKDLGYTL